MNAVEPSETIPEPVPSGPTAGQMLRAAREAKGIHLGQLSVKLKVSLRQLEALEADQHDALRGTAFVRALAQSVCRHIGVDPVPVLQALPKGDAPKALEPVALQAHQTTLVTGGPRFPGLRMSRQVLLLALLMVLAVTVLIWWPAEHRETSQPELLTQDMAQPAVSMSQASDPGEVLEPVASTESAAPVALGSAASAPVALVKPVVQAPAVLPVPQPIMAQSALVPARAASALPAPPPAKPASAVPVPPPAKPASAPPAATAPVQAPASAPALVIKAASEVWVSVRDSHGKTPLRRQLKAGETVSVDVAAPLFVYTNRADGVEVNWLGKPVALASHVQNNEVRLLIKP